MICAPSTHLSFSLPSPLLTPRRRVPTGAEVKLQISPFMMNFTLVTHPLLKARRFWSSDSDVSVLTACSVLHLFYMEQMFRCRLADVTRRFPLSNDLAQPRGLHLSYPAHNIYISSLCGENSESTTCIDRYQFVGTQLCYIIGLTPMRMLSICNEMAPNNIPDSIFIFTKLDNHPLLESDIS